MQDRIAIIIDGTNIHHASRALGIDIDYDKLLKWFNSQGRCVRALYYNSIPTGEEYSPVRRLVDWASRNGFVVVSRPDDGEAEKPRFNVDMACHMLELADRIDHFYICAGSAELRLPVDIIQRKGARVTVVSTVRTQPQHVSDSLRRQADGFIDLNDLKSIARSTADS
jgi:uncharacterized LabA/DUF88 family protein